MLHIQRFVCNMVQENCYVAHDDTRNCIIVDCGALYDEERKAIADYIRKEQLEPRLHLCTHAHFDHCFGVGFIHKEYGLAPVVCKHDKPLYDKLHEQVNAFTGMPWSEPLPAAQWADDGDEFRFGDHTIRYMLTPGHTPGSSFLVCPEEQLAFSGDTLFRMSVGRTDLEMGSFDQLMASMRCIREELPNETIVLPGHDQQTTIEFEIAHNPYMR